MQESLVHGTDQLRHESRHSFAQRIVVWMEALLELRASTMIGVVLTSLLPLALVWCWWLLPPAVRDRRALYIVLVGYAARLMAADFVHRFQFFTNGSGENADSGAYENMGRIIARLWVFSGVHYVTATELPAMADTSLPANLFALVQYLNTEPTHLGCTAFAAVAGCLAALNVYALAHDLGCRHVAGLWTLFAVTFLPTFFFYTADTYKDGLVACFVFGALGSAIRLARRFSAIQLLLGLVCLGALWLTRFYLVFIMTGPLIIGLLGVRSKSFGRIAATVVLLGISVIGTVAYSTTLFEASDRATQAFAAGTSDAAISENSEGGAGVVISGSGPRAFALKLAYALFSPFPWQSGSIALNLAKVEMILWYYFAYRALRSLRTMWSRRRSDAFLFALFVVPTIIAYTLSFSNVGLVVRERLCIVLATILLASLSWGTVAEDDSQRLASAPTPAE